jgi:hypothetical protein
MGPLDKIIASLLGTLPRDGGREEWARWMRAQHEELREEWRGEYGRLPPDPREEAEEGEWGGGEEAGEEEPAPEPEPELEKEPALEAEAADDWEDLAEGEPAPANGKEEAGEEEEEEAELVLSTPSMIVGGGGKKTGFRPGGRANP